VKTLELALVILGGVALAIWRGVALYNYNVQKEELQFAAAMVLTVTGVGRTSPHPVGRDSGFEIDWSRENYVVVMGTRSSSG
jgi:hypothetical protein